MATVIGPGDGQAGFLGSVGARFMIDGEATEGGFSLLEHPMAPRALGAPLHRHSREDEYSFVLEGRMGGLLGDEVIEAGPGDLVFKPRDQWHTFWNAGDEPARLLEIISPAGFERYFRELADMVAAMSLDPAELGALSERYGVEMKPESIPRAAGALRAGDRRARGDAASTRIAPQNPRVEDGPRSRRALLLSAGRQPVCCLRVRLRCQRGTRF